MFIHDVHFVRQGTVTQVIVTEKSDYVRLGENPNQLVTKSALINRPVKKAQRKNSQWIDRKSVV